MKKALVWIKNHKKSAIVAAAIIAAIAVFIIYSGISGGGKVTRYVLAQAEKQTIIATVSGSGQISASNQVDLTAKASGDVVAVKIKAGDAVKKGQLLVQLDAKEAYKSVRDAEIALQSAQLSLQKTERGTRAEETVSTKLALDDAKNNLDKVRAQADTDLAEKYADTKNLILDAYNKSDDAINRQLQGLYSDNTAYATLSVMASDSQAMSDCASLRADALSALGKIKAVLNNYPSDNSSIDSALSDSIANMSVMQKYFLRLNDLLNSAIPSGTVTQSTINSYKSSALSVSNNVTSALNSLASQRSGIASQKVTNANDILSAESSLSKAQNSYDLLMAGADPLDLAAQRLSVQQKINALSDAREQYANYAITAPFDGQVAKVSVQAGDQIANGGAIATVITPNKVAEINFSEVDIAKIKAGQKATLTFDAIEDLEITGQVAKADSVGTVSSGVVSYAVTISLDANDERIKPGMSVTASIITDTKVDALSVPNAAVKSKNGGYYVLTLPGADAGAIGSSEGVESDAAPAQSSVIIGIADDANTEIISGLAENDIVVAKTVTASKSSSASAPSLMQSLMPGRNNSSSKSSAKSSSSSSSGTTKSTTGSSGSSSSGGPAGDMGAPPGM